MADENNNGKPPSPKDAFLNLFNSVKTPLIFFGIGFATCLFWQERKRKRISGPAA